MQHVFLLLQEVLLSDSSDSSSDEDDEVPLTEEDLQEMLWLHKQQKIAQQMYYIDKDVSFFFLLEKEPFEKVLGICGSLKIHSYM